MTSLVKFPTRNRDAQDHVDRHIYSKIEYDGTIPYVKVKGTGTQDEELNLIRIGGSWNHPEDDADVEVFTLAGGADMAQKHAVIDTPWEKYHKTKPDTSGIQSHRDPDARVEFNKNRTHVTDKNIALGPNGEIEISNGKVIIRAPVQANSISAKQMYSDTVAPAPVVPSFNADQPTNTDVPMS